MRPSPVISPVVTGATSTAIVGAEFTPGVRAWVGERAPGVHHRVEALDGSGAVLHTYSRADMATTPPTC